MSLIEVIREMERQILSDQEPEREEADHGGKGEEPGGADQGVP